MEIAKLYEQGKRI